MNYATITLKILLTCLACAMLFTVVPAQAPEGSPAESTVEVTKEGDRLPFMQSDRDEQTSEEPSSAMLMVKSLGALMIIVGLIFFGAWGARKLGFGNTKPDTVDAVDLSVTNTLNLGGGRSLIAVNFEGRTLLVGSTANAFTLIAEKEDAEGSVSKPRSVAEMLQEEGVSFQTEFRAAEKRMQNDEVRI